MTPDRRHQSLHLDAEVQEEMKREAKRLDRSLSWLAQMAWKLAKDRIMAQPGPPETT